MRLRRPPNRCVQSAALGAVALLLAAACSREAADVVAGPSASKAGGPCPSALVEDGACEPFDSDRAAQSNEAYRQRAELSHDNAADAEAERVRIIAVLEQAARSTLTADEVIRLLRDVGYPNVIAYGRSDSDGGVAFGVDLTAGCVFGGIRGTEVTAEAGGATADAACLPAPGH